MAERIEEYTAAGAVVVHNGRVLVLEWPTRAEIRLPKGHIEPGETTRQAALREVSEESGCAGLEIVADLGAQQVTFEHRDRRVIRTERYFVMWYHGEPGKPPGSGEPRFDVIWLAWDDALQALTFPAEKEWVRRARRVVTGRGEPADRG